jgi:arylsulfatase A-like enzyme
VRSSLVAWGPGLIQQKNFVDRESVFSAIYLAPMLLELTGTPHPAGVEFDGESVAGALMGKGGLRQAPIFFRRPPDRDAFYGDDDLPDLAMRDGNWKLFCEYDVSDPELYDLEADRGETNNLADQHPQIVGKLRKALVAWHQSMPPDNGASDAPGGGVTGNLRPVSAIQRF